MSTNVGPGFGPGRSFRGVGGPVVVVVVGFFS